MSRPIVIESLSLQGFGPYRGEVRVDFPRGFGILVGPNELGNPLWLQESQPSSSACPPRWIPGRSASAVTAIGTIRHAFLVR